MEGLTCSYQYSSQFASTIGLVKELLMDLLPSPAEPPSSPDTSLLNLVSCNFSNFMVYTTSNNLSESTAAAVIISHGTADTLSNRWKLLGYAGAGITVIITSAT